MDRSDNHRIPDPGKKNGLRGKEATSRDPGLNAKNESANMRAKQPSNAKEDESKPSGQARRAVTNHDEENKIVNGGSDFPMDEKEQEGI